MSDAVVEKADELAVVAVVDVGGPGAAADAMAAAMAADFGLFGVSWRTFGVDMFDRSCHRRGSGGGRRLTIREGGNR